jgi:hypothetical protein
VLTFGYDHFTFVSTSDTFSYLDHNAEELNFSAYFALSSTTGAGLEASAVYNYYSQDFLNNSVGYNVGPFVETQITNYLKLRASVGYQSIDFATGGGVDDSSDASNYYANIVLSHRINAAITQSISAGHESQLGVNSNFILVNYVRHTATWNIINHLLLGTELFYETGDDSGGIFAEDIQRYGGAATFGYQLTPHVTLGLATSTFRNSRTSRFAIIRRTASRLMVPTVFRTKLQPNEVPFFLSQSSHFPHPSSSMVSCPRNQSISKRPESYGHRATTSGHIRQHSHANQLHGSP